MRTELDAFVHCLIPYDSDEALVSSALPLLRTERRPDHVTLLALPDHYTALLAQALGDRDLRIVPADEVYQRTAATLATYQRIVEELLAAGARRVTVMGDAPDLPDFAEFGRYESLLNLGLARYPVSVLCTYDTGRLSRETLEAAARTHPARATGGSTVPNARHLAPAEYLQHSMEARQEELPAGEPVLDLADVADLRSVREALRAALSTTTGADGPKFEFAVTEVATNAVRHGRGPVRVRVWTTADQVVCAVTDHGDGIDDPATGYLAPRNGNARPDAGRGLLTAHYFCDELTHSRTGEGFTVRLRQQRTR